MKDRIKKLIQDTILKLQKEKKFSRFSAPEIEIDYPGDEKFGDYTTNVAMVLAKRLGKNPMEIAEEIKNQISKIKNNSFDKIEIAKPGYINFYLSQNYLQGLVSDVNKKEEKFGNSNIGKKKKVLVEFISSNPTGPIHLGNGRGGPLGDTLANILQKAGFKTSREFYVNDFGNQVKILGHSVLGDKEAQYKGDYIDKLAKRLDAGKIKTLNDPREVGTWAAREILKDYIKPTCKKLGIKFDKYFSEKSLHDSGKIGKIIELFRKKKLAYEKDGAVWYKSTKFGDDKDRVLVKSDGQTTYFASDIAYHKDKFGRGFNKLIDIWGADHHGDVPRVISAVNEVLGEKNKLDIILTQFARVIKDGKEVRMSKRKGVYFALDDLIEEAGKDAVRFIFLSYTPTTHINFDINLAKERSEKNPVYYVQYAHARISSILRKAGDFQGSEIFRSSASFGRFGREKPSFSAPNLLTHEKELSLMKELNKFPELVEEISQSYEVHKLPHYAIKLADKFHNFYEACRVIDEKNPELSKARLNLVNAVRIVLAEVLRLMGIKAPDKM